MSGDLVPQLPELRISTAEREQLVAWLQSALADGRLTLDEFEARVDGVMTAKTYGEVETYIRDLPAPNSQAAFSVADPVELFVSGAELRRGGRWTVPRRLAVRNDMGVVRLDFTEAVLRHPTVDIEISSRGGANTLILPVGATVDTTGLRRGWVRRRVRSESSGRTEPVRPGELTGPGAGLRFVVTGTLNASLLTIRYRRRSWRRRR